MNRHYIIPCLHLLFLHTFQQSINSIVYDLGLHLGYCFHGFFVFQDLYGYLDEYEKSY